MDSTAGEDSAPEVRYGARSGVVLRRQPAVLAILITIGSGAHAVESRAPTSAQTAPTPVAASRAVPPPAAGAGAVQLPAAASTCIVPFSFEKDQIVVEVTLGTSGPFRFLLDTGTNPSVIDLKTAEMLSIPLGEAADSGSGAGTGPMQVRRCLLPALSLGPLTASGLEAAAADLSSLSTGFGRRIDGVLGYGFLKDRVFTIDYATRALTFYPPSRIDRSDLFRHGKGRKVLPFDYYGEDRTPFARALSVAGSPALRVTLDTGSSGSATIYYRTALRLGWKARLEEAPIKRSEGYRGSFPCAIIDSIPLSFAGHDLGPCEVSVPLPGSNYGEEGEGIADGNVGNGLLSGFRITFDYPGRVVLVEKIDAPPPVDKR